MNSDIHVKPINDRETFANLKDQWKEVLSESPIQSAFLSWEWLYSWWSVYGEHKRLQLITAWRGSQLVGVAPLMLEERGKLGVGLRVLTSLGTPQSDIGGFIYRQDDTEVVNSLFDYLSKQMNEWDIIELNEFLGSSLECSALKQTFSHDYSSITEEIKQHFYILLEGNWESYLKNLPKKFRYNLGRAVRLAEEIGPVECKHYTGENLNEDVIHTIVQINRYSHFPRLYNLSAEQAFLKILAQQMSHSSWFGAYLLFVNKQPVAYEYGFHYNSRFEDWRAGFDTRLASNISIGKALAMMVIQACYDQKITEIDFLRGDEPYKLEWKPAAREYANSRIFNWRSLRAFAAYQWLVKVKPYIKQFKSRY
ncbi:MAG TPA: GNAT family N-acetyltransferase [Anaerolineales bacterium]|nr:GNAT family N-acetyltransferase [Anaerolineales bacterium]